MKYLAFALFLGFPLAAAAQPAPGSIADCEKIKGDLAYNQCLAMFGPKVGERRRSAAAPIAEEDEPAVRRGGGGGRYAERRGGRGRMSASFDVGSRTAQRTTVRPKRSYTKRSYRRRRR
jgi:hypothetical protein